jgi:hypothetical protein
LGYTLIGEILGVTSLSWVCIGMMLRKLRHEAIEIPETVAQPIPQFKVEESPEYLALLEKVSQLEAEKLKLQEGQSGSAELEKLQKTISYLENKLLEYEIVQEEISILGELKAENEKLKLDLNALRSATAPAAAPVPAAEELIKKKFSEFAESAEPKKEAMPEDIQSLLSDIESLSKDKQPKP